MNDLAKAIAHYKITDSTMHKLALDYGDKIDLKYKPIEPSAYYSYICRTISGQQLSVKAASTIWGRVLVLIDAGKDDYFQPGVFGNRSDDELRACGLSYQKIGYLRSIAESIQNEEVNIAGLQTMNDEEVIVELTKLKGIGVWSAEMFLMTALARPDIFSVGDLGLVNGVQLHYGIDRKDKLNVLKQIEPLAPHRTIASMLLWYSLDNTPK